MASTSPRRRSVQHQAGDGQPANCAHREFAGPPAGNRPRSRRARQVQENVASQSLRHLLIRANVDGKGVEVMSVSLLDPPDAVAGDTILDGGAHGEFRAVTLCALVGRCAEGALLPAAKLSPDGHLRERILRLRPLVVGRIGMPLSILSMSVSGVGRLTIG